nr:sugar ABC transporter substrate-binding protein [Anaerolineae bacterium]
MKTRIFQIIAALTVLSMLLAACGGGAPAPAQPTAAPAPTQAPAATEAPAAAPEPTQAAAAPADGVAEPTPGIATDMILLPKFVGNKVFDEAHDGAKEAHAELQNPGKLEFVGPTADNSVAGQIEIVTNAPTQGAKAIMISNN